MSILLGFLAFVAVVVGVWLLIGWITVQFAIRSKTLKANDEDIKSIDEYKTVVKLGPIATVVMFFVWLPLKFNWNQRIERELNKRKDQST